MTPVLIIATLLMNNIYWFLDVSGCVHFRIFRGFVLRFISE